MGDNVCRRHLQLPFCVCDHVSECQIPHVLHCSHAGVGSCWGNIRGECPAKRVYAIRLTDNGFQYDLWSSINSPVCILPCLPFPKCPTNSALLQYSMTDSAGHIGGMLAGVAFGLAARGRGGFRGGPRVPWR